MGAGDLPGRHHRRHCAVGVHALTNQPASIVQSNLPTPLLLVLALLLAIAWPKLRSISNLRSR